MKFGHKIAIGLVAGFILGVIIHSLIGDICPTSPSWVKAAYYMQHPSAKIGRYMFIFCNTAGEIFLRLIRMIVIPLIFVSITLAVAELGDLRKLRKIGVVTILYFMGTTSLAVILGMILVNVIKPGVNTSLNITTFAATTPGISTSLLDAVIKIVPDNIFEALANPDILQIVFFGIILGAAIGMLGEKCRTILKLLHDLNHVINLIVKWILFFLPLGVLFLIARAFGQFGLGVISPLAKYMATVLTGLGIHLLIILPAVLWLLGKMNPLKAFEGLGDTMATAFSTSSSSATLPVNIRDCTENLGVPRRIANFVLPLGATINMDGTALYEAVAAIFIAQAYGLNLTITEQLTIFIVAILAAVGAAGIPQAGLFTIVIVLKSVNLPVEGIGLILAVDSILDMCRTTVNVLGDSFGTVVVARLTGETRKKEVQQVSE
ncbi:MAG: dicarboxylate/amino acid:cation symporter [Candidatus Eremiobacteraeota bacterium]|nr:dicarboxylate/amino acid:cation symporter [Candidatus Eremiobacteraeota bacterium]